jgi:hypothetical protein
MSKEESSSSPKGQNTYGNSRHVALSDVRLPTFFHYFIIGVEYVILHTIQLLSRRPQKKE